MNNYENLGLSISEYNKIIDLLGRSPDDLELGIFAACWSEHCSYKTTKRFLKKIYSKNKYVLTEFGDNAGIIDIGNDQALVFKAESHNHPSQIEPFNGAASGVGGILRDIFVMGAKPIALANILRFGSKNASYTAYYEQRISAGIAAYSNSFGVPTITGDVAYGEAFKDNILVNICALGIIDKKNIVRKKANIKNSKLGIYYLGKPTDRDGANGAVMASQSFGDNDISKETIQIADPFRGRCLYEAYIELVNSNLVIAATDCGAGGIATAIVELAEQNHCGAKIEIDSIPRVKQLGGKDLLLSESQERLIIVLDSRDFALAKKLCSKWSVAISKIGCFVNEEKLFIEKNSDIVTQIKLEHLTKQLPITEFHSEGCEKKYSVGQLRLDKKSNLLRSLQQPNYGSKKYFYRQYDSYIQGNTIQHPGRDCGVIKLDQQNKAVALKVCCLHPEEDAAGNIEDVVHSCFASLCAVGAQPLALTNNLNFGAPNNPAVMYDIINIIEKMGKAASSVKMPIISGNTSLYNCTNGKNIPATPALMGIGLLEDYNNYLKGFNNLLLNGAKIYFIESADDRIYETGCLVRKLVIEHKLFAYPVSRWGLIMSCAKLLLEYNNLENHFGGKFGVRIVNHNISKKGYLLVTRHELPLANAKYVGKIIDQPALILEGKYKAKLKILQRYYENNYKKTIKNQTKAV